MSLYYGFSHVFIWSRVEFSVTGMFRAGCSGPIWTQIKGEVCNTAQDHHWITQTSQTSTWRGFTTPGERSALNAQTVRILKISHNKLALAFVKYFTWILSVETLGFCWDFCHSSTESSVGSEQGVVQFNKTCLQSNPSSLGLKLFWKEKFVHLSPISMRF